MHKYTSLLTGLLLVAVFFVGCGNEPSTQNNEYLGELPSLEKQYVNKIDAKEKAIKKSTDMEESFKLSKELEQLKEERDKKIDEYASANPLTKPLPFEALEGTPYTIKEVTVNKASAGNLNIKFSTTINEDMKTKYGNTQKSLFIYYKAVDSQGNEIPESKTVATNFKSEPLTAGLDYEVFGSWQSDEVANMEDFAKIVEITKDEYK